MASLNQTGSQQFSLAVTNPDALLGIGLGLAVFLWLLGAMVFFGLPSYYRQVPGQVPTFYLSLFRRRIILVSLALLFMHMKIVLTLYFAVVFLCSLHFKLLAISTLRTKLALSLVQQTRLCMANHSPCPLLFHHCLGSCSLGLPHIFQATCLVHSYLRSGSRCP